MDTLPLVWPFPSELRRLTTPPLEENAPASSVKKPRSKKPVARPSVNLSDVEPAPL